MVLLLIAAPAGRMATLRAARVPAGARSRCPMGRAAGAAAMLSERAGLVSDRERVQEGHAGR